MDEKTIPDGSDARMLASYIIHEMFHCFQLSYGEKRFPNELLNIDYPLSIENTKLRSLERQFLLSACTETEKSQKLNFVNFFFSARRKREQLIGCNLDYEKAIETVEGTAVYVEFSVLKQLLGNEGLTLKDFTKGFSDINERNLNIRQSTYYQGLLLCIIAEEMIPNWKNDIINSDLFLSDYVYKSLPINIVEIDDTCMSLITVEQCISNWIKQRDKVFEEFEKNQGFNIIEENIKIIAFDPMNIVKRNQEVIHKNFLKIKVGDSEKVIKGPIKAILGDNIFDVKKIIW